MTVWKLPIWKRWRSALLACAGCAVLLLAVLLAWSRSPAPEARPVEAAAPPAAHVTAHIVPASCELFGSLNETRRSAGLMNIALDEEASRRCQKLALGLLQPNPIAAADDGPVVFHSEPSEALKSAVAQNHPRMLLLDGKLEALGLGAAHSEAGGWRTVVEVRRAPIESIVVYPAGGQRDVPAHFSGGPELPGPIARQNAGFPITVALPRKTPIADVRAVLSEAGKPVVCDLFKDPSFPGIGLLPKSPLRPNTTYRVDAALKIGGVPWSRTWTFTTGDDADSRGILAEKALTKINDYRRGAGLQPVRLDAELSRGCRNHARYLTINAEHPTVKGLGAHDEHRNRPGFTPEGQRAGQGVIADGQHDPLAALDAWMATFYHRVPLLDPRLTRIGFGCALGPRQTWITVMDVTTGRDSGTFKNPVVFPCHGQQNVPLCFSGNEVPDPIPDDRDGKAGFPITVTFPELKLAQARGSLRDAAGQEVPVWFSSPDSPANPRHVSHQGFTVCLIARDPLRPSSTYKVEVSGEVQGLPWKYSWVFSTGPAAPSSAQSAAEVLQRINFHRTQAGLPQVALDPAASVNCDAHARYLLANAGRISTKKFNDEDPLLPGFSEGGQATARAAAVFFHAPQPVVQIDTMIACFQRGYLLDPTLRRIGFGCGLEAGKGWTCVLDFSSGRGE